MSYAADDTQAIAQRLKELQAERDIALKGTSAPNDGQETRFETNTAIQSQWLGYDPA